MSQYSIDPVDGYSQADVTAVASFLASTDPDAGQQLVTDITFNTIADQES